MVQNKKNFSSGKKSQDTQELDRKDQSRVAGKSSVADTSSRAGSMKQQSGLSKDKSASSSTSKRDMGSRK